MKSAKPKMTAKPAPAPKIGKPGKSAPKAKGKC